MTLIHLKKVEKRGCHRYSLYKCTCGNEKVIREDAVKRGQSSCGCARGAHLRTHGLAYTNLQYMLDRSKSRARKKGFEHNIDIHDINIPAVCPLLGIPLFSGNVTVGPNSPTLDRLDSSKGYIKGNVWVISYRANTIKNDATPEELERIARGVRKEIKSRL